MVYRNIKCTLKHKISVTREEAVQGTYPVSLQTTKKIDKNEKDERFLWKEKAVADFKAAKFLNSNYNDKTFINISFLNL